MKKLFLITLVLCLLVGCRSSKSVSSSMHQHTTSNVVQTSDSVGLSLSHQLQRMIADGSLSARIIRFYPSDSLSPLVLPDQPLPSSMALPLTDLQACPVEQPANASLPPFFPFGQISSITDIHFDGHLQQESGSSQLNASARNDSIDQREDIDTVSSSSKVTKSDSLPWYKIIIIFGVAVLLCFIFTVLLRGK